MKTLIIYNSTDSPLHYAIVEGDYSDLNGIRINSFDEDTIKLRKHVNFSMIKREDFASIF